MAFEDDLRCLGHRKENCLKMVEVAQQETLQQFLVMSGSPSFAGNLAPAECLSQRG